jgi:hypothetical protein
MDWPGTSRPKTSWRISAASSGREAAILTARTKRPTAVCLENLASGSSRVLLGGRDGYVRYFDDTADTGGQDVRPVDLWIVVGREDAPRARAMIEAFKDQTPVIVLAGTEEFRPTTLAGFEFIAVLPTAPEDVAAAAWVEEFVKRAASGARVQLFGDTPKA